MAWFVYAMRIMWPVNGRTEAQLISFASTLEETRIYCETGTNFRLVGLKNILGSADFFGVWNCSFCSSGPNRTMVRPEER